MRILFILTLILCSYPFFSIDSKEIDNSIEPISYFEKLFSEEKIQTILEFGTSARIPYFLQRGYEVDSCEIMLPTQTEEAFRYVKDPHWTFILKRGTLALQIADETCFRDQKDPALYDATYILELKKICDDLFLHKTYEMAIVDPKFHMYGDLVNELFDRVPIIVAHNTQLDPKTYGWNKVHVPCNYEKISFPIETGVTFWIRKDKQHLIATLNQGQTDLTSYAEKKQLRIFFPQIHPILVQSMALALQYLGHTLVLPGESFDPLSPTAGLKISYGTFFKKNPLDTHSFTQFFSKSPRDCDFLSQQVEVLENDELLSNPPDVLFVNCLQVEQSVYAIWNYFKKHQTIPPKLAHYSGNNASHYKSEWVKNLIAVDAYTATYYDPMTTQIITWLPWIDFKNLEFESFNDTPIINTYISHYYAAFQKSAMAFYDILYQAQVDFPKMTFGLYPKSVSNMTVYTPHLDMLSLIDQSCATMHIKETEGFGYTIIESLAKGRPVFLKRSFSLGSRLMNWCIEGKTAFFFDDYNEFQSKLQRYTHDLEYRHQIQTEAALTIRKLIDNEKQARILENFLQNLK